MASGEAGAYNGNLEQRSHSIGSMDIAYIQSLGGEAS